MARLGSLPKVAWAAQSRARAGRSHFKQDGFMMTVMKTTGFLVAAAFVLALAPASLMAGEQKAEKAKKESSGEDLFAKPAIHRLKVELSDSALEALRKDPKQYVKATVREGDKVYADVGARLKGSGSFQAVDKKPGLSLKFD